MSNDLAPFSACSSPVVNSSSIPDRRRAVAHQPAHGPEDRHHGGLVVGAEDGVVAVREEAVLAHHLDRPVERDRVHVRAQQHGGRALGSRARARAGCRSRSRSATAVSSSSTSMPEAARAPPSAPAATARSRARRALDLAEADELGEEPLALLARHGVNHARERYRSIGQPSRSQRGTPPSTTWITSPRAEPLQQAGGDRGALAGRADHRHRLRGVEPAAAARGCRGRRCGSSRGCGRASHSERSRTSSSWSPFEPPSQRSCSSSTLSRSTRSTGRFSSRQRGHAAGEVAGDVGEPDRAGQLGRLAGVLVVAAHEHERLPAARPATRAWCRSRRAAR